MNTDDLYDMLGLGDALPDIPEDRIAHMLKTGKPLRN